MRFERPTIDEMESWLTKIKGWVDITVVYLLHMFEKIKKFRGCAIIESDGKGNRAIDIEDTFKKGYVCFYSSPTYDTKVIFIKEEDFEKFFSGDNGWSAEDLKEIAKVRNGEKVSYQTEDIVIEKV